MNKNTCIAVFIIIVLGIVLWVFISSNKSEEIPETDPVTVSTLSINSATSPASAVLAGARIINWETSNYPTDAGVNINLIRKVSDSPREFLLVRTLETNTTNDGEASWVPQDGENSDDLYIEVTCSNDYQFQTGCSLASDPIKVN